MRKDREQIVLVIDDDANIHAAVDAVLGPPLVDRVLHALSPGDGLRKALLTRPDAILLDINMPGMDGFKVCRTLRENGVTQDIPIIFLTAETKVDQIAKALDCGAEDYVSKPPNGVELQARLRVALRGKRLIEMLKEQARVDALTGLMNRTALDDGLRALSSSHERSGEPGGLLLIDIDYFKSVNDSHGHGVGDEILRRVGGALRASCRPYDTPCRMGGDEFAVVLSRTETAGALNAAERMMDEIRAIRVTVAEEDVAVTASAGLVCCSRSGLIFQPADLLKAADDALYEAKAQGRNRVVAKDF